MTEPAALPVLLPVAVTCVVFAFFWLVGRRVDPWLLRPGSLALLGHAVVAVLVLSILPYTWDIGAFHDTALTIIEGAPTGESDGVTSFATFQSLVYSAFAPSPVAVGIVNGLLAVLVVLPARELAHRLYPSLQSTKGLALVVLFLPLPFLYLSIPMRDALSTLLFFTIVAALVRSYATGHWGPTAMAIPLFGILELLRAELTFVILIGVAAGAGVHVLRRVVRTPLSVRAMIATATPVGLAALPLLGPHFPVSGVEDRMLARTRGSAAYLEGSTFDGWIDLVLAAPLRGVFFQFAPFPLHVTQAFHLLAALMLPILVVVAVAAYRSASACDRDVVILSSLATVYVVGVVGYGLVDANFGTTARHRIPFTFLLCVLAAPVFERWERRVRSRLGVVAERVGE